jgi:hypothetical protein
MRLFKPKEEKIIETFKDLGIKNIKKVSWEYVQNHKKLSEGFIEEYHQYFNWTRISRTQRLSEEFIRKYQGRVQWGNITEYQKLSENFLREFENKVVWLYVASRQELSEEFIVEFKDRLSWKNVFINQVLSYNFIKRNITKPGVDKVFKNNKIELSEREKKEIARLLEFKNTFKKDEMMAKI